MKLYELLKMSEADFDTYDTVFDTDVTVCYIDENGKNDSYDKFCINITKKVEVVRIIPESHLICDWSKLVYDNMEKFRALTEKYWDNQYTEDEDEFVYQWITEIHYYLAGYAPEDFYDTLVEFVDSLKA